MNRDGIFPSDGSFKIRSKTIEADKPEKLDEAFNAWVDATVDNKTTIVVSTQYQVGRPHGVYASYSVHITYLAKK